MSHPVRHLRTEGIWQLLLSKDKNDFVKQEYGNYSTLFTKHRLGDLADLKLFLK